MASVRADRAAGRSQEQVWVLTKAVKAAIVCLRLYLHVAVPGLVAAALTRATMTNHKQISRCTSTQLVTHRHARQLAIHAQRHVHGDVRANQSAQRRLAVRLCSRVVAPSCDAEALSLLLPVLCVGGRSQRIRLGGGADAVLLSRLFRVRQRVTNVGT